MFDASFDAVLIGGGNKGMPAALYLAKYGGMDVAVFERRHELGGAHSGREGAAPGFMSMNCAAELEGWYYLPVQEDFPDFEEKGAKIAHPISGLGIICKEDDTCLIVYHENYDPSGELTVKEFVKFSGEKDADTMSKILELNKPGGPLWRARLEQIFNLPPPPGESAPLAKFYANYIKQPNALIDYRWTQLPLFQAARELWDSKGIQRMFLGRQTTSGGKTPYMTGFSTGLLDKLGRDYIYIVGGTHNLAHAYVRIFLENGGKFFTKSPVDKILIENGKAKGIRLQDGTQIEAKKLVLSGVDPHQLCFKLVGKEHLSPKIIRKIECLERSAHQIMWYTVALHELPKYKAAAFNPDVGSVNDLILGDKNPELFLEQALWRRLGQHHPGSCFNIVHHGSQYDKTLVPEGKHIIQIEEEEIPAYMLSERQWMERKKEWIEKVIRVYHDDYAPNMTWDNVIGYDAITPYDTANEFICTGPAGHPSIINSWPGQLGGLRPIQELAQYRTPIENLYATGSGWSGAGASCDGGYLVYKAIAEDLGLRKPWEEKGRPW